MPGFLFSAATRCRAMLAAGAVVFISGCATTGGADPRDPLEGLNRSVYGFNQAIDEAVLKPVSIAYRENLPEIVQTGVRNFFSNISDIFIGVNNLLQGKVIDAASDGMRFALNTTIGGLGVLDWASEMGLEKHNEDFGQTFGRWGIGAGAYIVWPVLGSSTVRDSFGRVLDITVDPVSNHSQGPARSVMYLTRGVSLRADLLDASRLLEEAALDKYVFERDAYFQRRHNLIHDGRPPRETSGAIPAQPAAVTARPPEAPEDRPAAVSYAPGLPRNYERVMAASVSGGESRD